jgi:hypothetical protein
MADEKLPLDVEYAIQAVAIYSSKPGPEFDAAFASLRAAIQAMRREDREALSSALDLLNEMFEAFVVDNIEMTPWQVEAMQKVQKVLAPQWRVSRKLAKHRALSAPSSAPEPEKGGAT